MAFTVTYHLRTPPDQVLMALTLAPHDPGRPPMPARLTGRIAQTEVYVRLRGRAFVMGYTSRVRPGPTAEVRGRVESQGGRTRLTARVGLSRWMTTYNSWILAAVAVPFAWQGSWWSVAGILAMAGVAAAINRGYDAGVTDENEEARYLAACLDSVLAPLLAAAPNTTAQHPAT